MQFQILSHAGLAVTAGGKTLLCDPWIVGSCYWRSWWNYPPVSPELVASLRPDYIYLTHIHWDHFHGPSLRRLGKDVQILLPREHYPRMRIDLDAMGFKNVREMGHGETVELAPGFRATSYGFLFPDSGLVMEAEGVTLFDANDAKFMGLPLTQVLRRHPRIDFVFCSHSSANQRLCFEIIDDPTQAVDDLDIYITRFANFVRRTGTRYAIPFASNHCYLHKDTWPFNDFAQTPMMVAAHFRHQGIASTVVQHMVSGDSYSSEGDSGSPSTTTSRGARGGWRSIGSRWSPSSSSTTGWSRLPPSRPLRWTSTSRSSAGVCPSSCAGRSAATR